MRFQLIALSIIATASLLASPSQQQFRSRADAVVIDVTVLQNDRLITDLAAQDFAVSDNGVRQEVVDLSREPLPMDLTLLLDRSDSVRGALASALDAATDRVRRVMRTSDTARVVAFASRRRDVQSPAVTAAASATRFGSTSLFDGIALCLPALTPPGRRAALIVFTDGLDTSSFVEDSQVLEVARRTSPTVFAVTLVGPNDKPFADRQDAFFRELASITGGRLTTIKSEKDLSTTFLQAIDDARNAYVLRYIPTGVSTAGWHDVAITLKKSGKFEVRARKGYSR